jgi:hypothetical protein
MNMDSTSKSCVIKQIFRVASIRPLSDDKVLISGWPDRLFSEILLVIIVLCSRADAATVMYIVVGEAAIV